VVFFDPPKETAKESLKRGMAKLPIPCRVVVEKIAKDEPEEEAPEKIDVA
jgi:ribosomal protein L16/L10AE